MRRRNTWSGKDIFNVSDLLDCLSVTQPAHVKSQAFLDEMRETDCAAQVTANALFTPSVDQATEDIQSWKSLLCLCNQTSDLRPQTLLCSLLATIVPTISTLTYRHKPPKPTSSLGWGYIRAFLWRRAISIYQNLKRWPPWSQEYDIISLSAQLVISE